MMTIQKIAATAAVLGLTVGLSALPAQAANKTSSTHMTVWDTDGTLDIAEENGNNDASKAIRPAI
jgi:hypothetical protein